MFKDRVVPGTGKPMASIKPQPFRCAFTSVANKGFSFTLIPIDIQPHPGAYGHKVLQHRVNILFFWHGERARIAIASSSTQAASRVVTPSSDETNIELTSKLVPLPKKSAPLHARSRRKMFSLSSESRNANSAIASREWKTMSPNLHPCLPPTLTTIAISKSPYEAQKLACEFAQS